MLSVGRLVSIKRVDLLLKAMPDVDPSLRLLVVGEGPHRELFEEVAEEYGLNGRVEFVGRVSDETLLELYAGALAVVFVPYDEDYGLVTLEAFLARKPVVTASDSGGTLEFVEDGVSGVVCAPEAGAVADALNRLVADRGLAARWGKLVTSAPAPLPGTASSKAGGGLTPGPRRPYFQACSTTRSYDRPTSSTRAKPTARNICFRTRALGLHQLVGSLFSSAPARNLR